MFKFKITTAETKSPFLVLYIQFSSSASTCCPQTDSSPSLRNSLFVCLDREEKFIQLTAREREPGFALSLKEPEAPSFFIFFHIKFSRDKGQPNKQKAGFLELARVLERSLPLPTYPDNAESRAGIVLLCAQLKEKGKGRIKNIFLKNGLL